MSPILDSPSDSVTSNNRCFGNYKSCRYYMDDGESNRKEGLEMFTEDEKVEQEISFYNKINVLEKPLDSECKYFQVIRTEKGIVAMCKIMGRILTESQAKLCSTQWKNCPIRLP